MAIKNMKLIESLKNELQRYTNTTKAKFLQGYFKTGKGEYGEGDEFIGLTVPLQRNIAKNYARLSIKEVEELLHSKIHEYRQIALMILGFKFKTATKKEQKGIYIFYLKNTRSINNWDLIDGSAPVIVGGYLSDKPRERKILYKLAVAKNLWERRIAILATYTFIKQKNFQYTFDIARILLYDAHDLIHKAVGWMLREIGKLDQVKEEQFLGKYYKKMPRTMLRYAIEKFPENKRKAYLKGMI